MPMPRKYADEKQRKQAYRLRKRTAKSGQSEQIQTINEGGRFGGLFGLEKPISQTWEHTGQVFKILVITFPLDVNDLTETEKGLLALSNAQNERYRVIDHEQFSKQGTRFIRYTLSKRKR
jgi:hypothetical protein